MIKLIYMFLLIIFLGFMMKLASSLLYSKLYNYSKLDFNYFSLICCFLCRIIMVKSPMLEENIPQLLTDVIDITFTRPTEYPYYECMDAH